MARLTFFIAAAMIVTAAIAQNVDLDCPPVTLCYAIDESGSITRTQFEKQTRTLVSITNEIEKLTPNSTYAAVGFSNTASVIQNPTKNVNTIVSALESNGQARKGTSLGSGLLLCDQIIENAPHPRVIMLITDGKDRKGPFGVDVDDDIKAKGTVITTIGVGSEAVEDELRQIASEPNLYTEVDNFTDLVRSISDIVQTLCEAIPSTTPTPSLTPSSSPSTSVSSEPATVPSSSASPTSSTSEVPSTSSTPAITPTSTPSSTASSSSVASVTPTSSPSSAASSSGTASDTPTASSSSTASLSSVPSSSNTPSSTPSEVAPVSTTPTSSPIPSVTRTPTSTSSAAVTPSSSASSSAVASASTSPAGNCAVVQCGKCGNRLECYVNSGSRTLDGRLFRIIRRKSRFCTWNQWLTSCGQQCRSVSHINCYTRRNFPISRASKGYNGKVRFCRTRKARRSFYTMTSVATYNICLNGNKAEISCAVRKCDDGSDNVRCDRNQCE